MTDKPKGNEEIARLIVRRFDDEKLDLLSVTDSVDNLEQLIRDALDAKDLIIAEKNDWRWSKVK